MAATVRLGIQPSTRFALSHLATRVAGSPSRPGPVGGLKSGLFNVSRAACTISRTE